MEGDATVSTLSGMAHFQRKQSVRFESGLTVIILMMIPEKYEFVITAGQAAVQGPSVAVVVFGLRLPFVCLLRELREVLEHYVEAEVEVTPREAWVEDCLQKHNKSFQNFSTSYSREF